MFQHLFSPLTIRGMTLKNRAILPAMGTKFPKNNEVTQQLIDYHVARVVGGSALNIVEVSGVHAGSTPAHYLSLAEDRFIPGLKKLTAAIHEHGGKAGVQLWQGSIAVMSDPNSKVFVASDLPISAEYTIPGISKEEIIELIDCYGQAAKRAVSANFDCIEIHVAHNYILHSFLSSGINYRTDEYGGSFENRAKFPLAVIEEIRSNIPDDMPLFMRIDAHDDYLENGLSIEEVIKFTNLAKEYGVDVVDVSRGNIISNGLKYEVPPIDIPQGFNIDNAARIRKETGMLTMGVGRINTAELANDILEKEEVDLVGIGRAQISDPDFLTKAKAGQLEDIVYCVACNQGCYDACERADIPHITCLRNPSVGKEREYTLTPTEKPEKVLVAGGGLAGLEAAMVLKQRGHDVTLYEGSNHLGGQFLLAGMAPRKSEMKEAAVLKGEQVKRAGVAIHLNTVVDKELIAGVKPDSVINAIGAVPIELKLPGIEQENVYDYVEILNREIELSGEIVVIGGGLVGLEVAETLAKSDNQVAVIEMQDEVAKDLGTTRKIEVMEHLAADQVEIYTNTTCSKIQPDGVVVERDGQHQVISCDHVVIAVGAKSRAFDEVRTYCEQANIRYHVIGDAFKPRRALDATAEAAQVARSI